MITKLMPRRIPDYPDAFAGWNLISSLGSLISVVATVIFIYIVYDIFKKGEHVSENPWSIVSFFEVMMKKSIQVLNFYLNKIFNKSIEWTMASPAPFHALNPLPIQS